MKNPAALRSGVLAWVERREVEKRRMMQNTAHGFRVCIHVILDIAVELVKKIRTFYFISRINASKYRFSIGIHSSKNRL